MGVPVVTLSGQRFVGRASAAMLGLVGLDDLVAADEAAYVETVLRLASDRRRRASKGQSERRAARHREEERGRRAPDPTMQLWNGAFGPSSLQLRYIQSEVKLS